jgi:hypothetical protein
MLDTFLRLGKVKLFELYEKSRQAPSGCNVRGRCASILFGTSSNPGKVSSIPAQMNEHDRGGRNGKMLSIES